MQENFNPPYWYVHLDCRVETEIEIEGNGEREGDGDGDGERCRERHGKREKERNMLVTANLLCPSLCSRYFRWR